MNKLIAKSFLWMAIGLLVTFVTGYLANTSFNIMYALFTKNLYILLVIIEILMVVFLSTRIHYMNSTVAKIVFILYSLFTGFVFSAVFLVYNVSYILFVFLIAAILFLFFGFFGYHTRIDLSKAGNILLMGLIGVILLEVLNILLFKGALNIILCIIFLLIFLGITAWDLQKLKYMSDDDNLAIYGALQLYLDFINILIVLLRLLSRRQ